jgi:hypothetical protein
MAKFGRRGSKAIPLWVRLVDIAVGIAIVVVAGYIELTLAQFSEWMLFGVVVLIEAVVLYLWFRFRRRFVGNPYFYSHHFEFTNDGVRIVNRNGDSMFIPRDLALSEMCYEYDEGSGFVTIVIRHGGKAYTFRMSQQHFDRVREVLSRAWGGDLRACS